MRETKISQKQQKFQKMLKDVVWKTLLMAFKQKKHSVRAKKDLEKTKDSIRPLETVFGGKKIEEENQRKF